MRNRPISHLLSTDDQTFQEFEDYPNTSNRKIRKSIAQYYKLCERSFDLARDPSSPIEVKLSSLYVKIRWHIRCHSARSAYFDHCAELGYSWASALPTS